MLFATLSAAAVLGASPVHAEYVGFDQRIDDSRWSRYDFALTNQSDENQTLALCPQDAALGLNSHRREEVAAFAVKFDKDAWSFGCSQRLLEPGEKVVVGVFFRPQFLLGSSRNSKSFDISMRTNLGSFLMRTPLDCEQCTGLAPPQG